MWCPWFAAARNQSLTVDTFLANARRRIRAQQLKAEQFWQESEEALMSAKHKAALNDRSAVRFHLTRQKQLANEYQMELDQAQVLFTALQTVERALSNAIQAQQLQQTNAQLADLLQHTAAIEEAVETLQEHHGRVAMDGQTLARSLEAAIDIEEEEVNNLLAAAIELPTIVGSKQTCKTSRSPQLLPDV
jgi:hypothetical protein